jgi:hypothetical protein
MAQVAAPVAVPVLALALVLPPNMFHAAQVITCLVQVQHAKNVISDIIALATLLPYLHKTKVFAKHR